MTSDAVIARTLRLVNQPHYVYRVYSADDTLLYVGCTHNVERRLREHRYRRPWRSEIARVTVDGPFPRRPLALAVERAAIKAEAPLYNGLSKTRRKSVAA